MISNQKQIEPSGIEWIYPCLNTVFVSGFRGSLELFVYFLLWLGLVRKYNSVSCYTISMRVFCVTEHVLKAGWISFYSNDFIQGADLYNLFIYYVYSSLLLYFYELFFNRTEKVNSERSFYRYTIEIVTPILRRLFKI